MLGLIPRSLPDETKLNNPTHILNVPRHRGQRDSRPLRAAGLFALELQGLKQGGVLRGPNCLKPLSKNLSRIDLHRSVNRVDVEPRT